MSKKDDLTICNICNLTLLQCYSLFLKSIKHFKLELFIIFKQTLIK